MADRRIPRITRFATLFVVAISSACVDEAAGRAEDAFEEGATVAGATADFREPLADSARALIAAGRPWRATLLLSPALGDAGEPASPALRFMAASAAAGWGGWSHVERHLAGAAWLDTLFDGEGHVLLARAALASAWSPGTRDSSALAHAARAVATARNNSARSRRLVILARASERAGEFREAASAYARGAELLPAAHDWLVLRAAALEPEGARRERRVATLRTAVAKARVPWVEAQARALHGDVDGAVRAYFALGEHAAALRVRLERGVDDSARDSVRGALLALVRQGGGGGREAVQLLDLHFAPLAAAEQLAVARSAAVTGPASRAVTAFAAAARGAALTGNDRFAWASTLARLGRLREAVAEFGRVQGGADLVAQARYQRARSLLRAGDGRRARAALERLLVDHPTQRAAASAQFLLGDLASDAGRDTEARRRFRDLARRHPSSALTPNARFRAALIAYVNANFRTASAELDSVAQLRDARERSASLYWSGRALRRAGDSTAADVRWRSIVERDPTSYYAVLAARRLGEPWKLPAVAGEATDLPETTRSLARAALLDSLGLDPESQFEYQWLERAADSSASRLMAIAEALRAHGHASRAIRLGARAAARGAQRDSALYRVLYPLPWRDVIVAEAAPRNLDPGFVAALIRQESNFTPGATSAAGARGLMQVMPSVGRSLASARGFPLWDAALLYQPDVSIQLGTAHLAAQVAKYGDPELVLAAYNAGASRVDRWMRAAGATDRELFVERIPFVETRDYVRIVMRNREAYRALYGL